MAIIQLTVVIENAPGKAADALSALAQVKVNVLAASVVENADLGLLRLVVDKPNRATDALRKKGLTVSSEQVLAVAVKDRPGALAKMLAPLKARKINVDYLYASTCACEEDSCGCGPAGCDSMIIIRAKDVKAAEAALKKAKYRIIKL
jgi:hypothetical protein